MATKKAAPKKANKKAPAKKAVVKKAPIKAKAKKKSAPKVTNMERLTAAGVIPAENVQDHDHKVINKLSAAEVNTLIKLRKKMGEAPLATMATSRPNFPV